jgi:GNAT superfamily N-acetyltransferase
VSSTETGPVIRPISAADHAEWLELWRAYITFYEASVPDDVTAFTFDRVIDEGEAVYGAIARDASGRAVGIVHWLTHPATWSRVPYVYLEDLYVDAEVRGGGVGRALIAHVEGWAREHGAAKVYWLTHETNATARALYDRVASLTGFVHYEIPLT